MLAIPRRQETLEHSVALAEKQRKRCLPAVCPRQPQPLPRLCAPFPLAATSPPPAEMEPPHAALARVGLRSGSNVYR